MGYIVAIFLLIIVCVLFWIRHVQNNLIKELRSKTDTAMSSESLIKVEYDAPADLGKIAENFNALGKKYIQQKEYVAQFDQLKNKHNELSGMVNVFESSISQVTLITDIGKDITSSLDLNDILRKAHKYIISSMEAQEVHFLIEKQGQKMVFVLKDKSLQLIPKGEWTENKDNILNWVFANNKEMILHDAEKDYGQYVFKPIQLFDKRFAASVIGLPFGFNTKQTGSIAVLGTKQRAFDSYHLDLIKSMASYIAVAIANSNLFEEVGDEKKKSDGLLLNILPQGVLDELKIKGSIEPRQFNNVSVLFTDMVNFTGISEKMSPTELVAEIHKNFTAFDAIIERNGLEKIKTIGDAFLAVCGLPHESADHAIRVVRAATEIISYMQGSGTKFQIRIGIHSGPVVAGIVGVKKYAYDIWGDTVNTAARMEQNSEPGKVNISGTTYDLIKDEFDCFYRGKIEAKNKGEIDMYFVEQVKKEVPHRYSERQVKQEA